MRTGILGGTFDPIHIAHLHAGETAMHQMGLDRMVFLPAGAPWQKAGNEVAAADHRLEMVRLAIAGTAGFEVDDREVRRDGPTYTIDTLREYPDEEELFLVVGADAALGLPTWKDPGQITQRATVVVAPRPGTDSIKVAEVIPDAEFLDMAVLEVSGTEIRAMAADGSPFRFLVPWPVYEYIVANGLYTERGETDMVGGLTDMEETS